MQSGVQTPPLQHWAKSSIPYTNLTPYTAVVANHFLFWICQIRELHLSIMISMLFMCYILFHLTMSSLVALASTSYCLSHVLCIYPLLGHHTSVRFWPKIMLLEQLLQEHMHLEHESSGEIF